MDAQRSDGREKLHEFSSDHLGSGAGEGGREDANCFYPNHLLLFSYPGPLALVDAQRSDGREKLHEFSSDHFGSGAGEGGRQSNR